MVNISPSMVARETDLAQISLKVLMHNFMEKGYLFVEMGIHVLRTCYRGGKSVVFASQNRRKIALVRN